MKQLLSLLCCGLLLLPCCGCTSDASQPGQELSKADTVSTLSSALTAAAESQTTAAASVTSAVPGETEQSAHRDDSAVSTAFQGGIGDEEHAETPKPEFFVYRFQPDAFSARLAGGNYQTVEWDFSEAFSHQIDAEYFLEDQNEDGCFDLYIPASYDADANITAYYVFLWDPNHEKFMTEPVTAEAGS